MLSSLTLLEIETSVVVTIYFFDLRIQIDLLTIYLNLLNDFEVGT